MHPRPFHLVLLVATVGTALLAGVFFAFSTFVMPALGRLPALQAVAAMQAINLAALNRWLLGALLGTSAACATVGVGAALDLEAPGARLALLGSALGLGGVLVVTAVFNVPRNEALAALLPGDPELAARWLRYQAEWTLWNHVRTAASLGGAVVLAVAQLTLRG
jgi:uncharacterized membrane protein